MNIVILAGGTGSIALQEGLHEVLEKNLDGIEIKVIVNAYDNGLSTGAVRRVLDGQILGPSDVRKNQTTRMRLREPNNPWIPFLECRFTESAAHSRDLCRDKILDLVEELGKQGRTVECSELLLDAIERFFAAPKAADIVYEDFSLANVIYAGLAAANGNSLRAAATIMARALALPDNVLLNDDESLFLGAITRSGVHIVDEGDIVTWGRESDPIADVFFVDARGREAQPELCIEAWRALIEADLVILSAGTQWSSLIPTYASRRFKAAIRSSQAQVLMVMNRTPDKDSPGQTSADIVEVLVPRYFDEGRLHVLVDRNAHPRMRHWTDAAREKVASITEADLARPGDASGRHDPLKLVWTVAAVCFGEHFASNCFVFDYDNTLCGRPRQYPKSSRYNVEGIQRLNCLTDVAVCTGNTIRAVNLRGEGGGLNGSPGALHPPLRIFADGGANLYSYDMEHAVESDAEFADAVQCISPHTLLDQTGPHSAGEIIEVLRRAGIPSGRIENRGGAVIAIKPIGTDERHAMMSLVCNVIAGSDLEAVATGKSTIEIRKRALTKVVALQHLCALSRNAAQITYVGDELESGNDRDIAEFAAAQPRIKCLRVNSPAKTAFFIGALINRLQQDGER